MRDEGSVDLDRVVNSLNRFTFSPSQQSFRRRNISSSSMPYANGEVGVVRDVPTVHHFDSILQEPPTPFERRESRLNRIPFCEEEPSSSSHVNPYRYADGYTSLSNHGLFDFSSGVRSVTPYGSYFDQNITSPSHPSMNTFSSLEPLGYGEVSERIRRKEEQERRDLRENRELRTREPPRDERERPYEARRHPDNLEYRPTPPPDYRQDRGDRSRYRTLPITPTHDRSRSQPPQDFDRRDTRRKSFAKTMAKKFRSIFGVSSKDSSKKYLTKQNSHPAPQTPQLQNHREKNGLVSSQLSLHDLRSERQKPPYTPRQNTQPAPHSASQHSLAQQPHPSQQTSQPPPSTAKVEEPDSGVDSPGNQFTQMSPPLLYGLPNLGNTCYVNAVVQALAASESLAEFFISEAHNRTLQDRTQQQQIRSQLHGSNGAVTRALAQLVAKLYSNKCTEMDIRQFKTTVGSYSNEYRTFNQQDAQEFLNWLLDKVHEDLNMAKRDTNYNYPRDDMSPDDALAERRLSHHSVITDIFEGQLRSSIVCDACNYQKYNFEPYMYVSLPIHLDSKRPLFCTVVKPNLQRFFRYGIRVDARGTLSDVKACLSEETKIPLDRMLILQTSPSGFRSSTADHYQVSSMVGPEAFVVELAASMDDQIDQRINIVFVHCVRSKTRLIRETLPCVTSVYRQWSYNQIASALMNAARFDLRPQNPGMPPLNEFRLALVDDVNFPSYIDDSVPMPLLTQAADQCILHNERIHRQLPKFLRVIVEWAQTTRRVFNPDPDRSINHKSADCLQRDNLPLDITLQSCMKIYTSEERIDWRCEHCLRTDARAAKKQLKFNSVPQILIVHLKRFRHASQELSEPVKIDIPVKFPIEGLDVREFVCGPDDDSRGGSLRKNSCGESVNDFIYDLFAVVNHKGDRVSSGHYTSTVKNPVDGLWRTFDDTNVTTNTDPREEAGNTYLLFYEKRSDRLQRQNRRNNGSVTRINSSPFTRSSAIRENSLPNIPQAAQRASTSGAFRRGDATRRAANPPSATHAAAMAGLNVLPPLPAAKNNTIPKQRESALWR